MPQNKWKGNEQYIRVKSLQSKEFPEVNQLEWEQTAKQRKTCLCNVMKKEIKYVLKSIASASLINSLLLFVSLVYNLLQYQISQIFLLIFFNFLFKFSSQFFIQFFSGLFSILFAKVLDKLRLMGISEKKILKKFCQTNRLRGAIVERFWWHPK